LFQVDFKSNIEVCDTQETCLPGLKTFDLFKATQDAGGYDKVGKCRFKTCTHVQPVPHCFDKELVQR